MEAASGGWLFLDEVASLSSAAQIALLRVLENQEIIRVGETQARKVKVRILSATNEPLAEMVKAGKFRRDLWQRLVEEEIILPPLRESKEEIPALIEHFCKKMDGCPYSIFPEAIDVLKSYGWADGNVRELRNTLRAITILHVKKTLSISAMPQRVWKALETLGDRPIA